MTNTKKPTNNRKETENKTASTGNRTEKKVEPKVQPKAQPKVEQSKNDSGKGLSIAAIILVLLVGGGLAYQGQQVIEQQNSTIASLKASLQGNIDQVSSNINSTLGADIKSVAKQTSDKIGQSEQMLRTGLAKNDTVIAQQAADIKSLQTVVTELKGRSPSDWLITESDYLVKMAGRKIWLEHDIPSAIELLRSADIRIAELNDPSLTPVRQAFAEDITLLSALPRIDRDALVLRIASIEDQIGSLPIDGALLPQAEIETKPVVSNSLENWKENLEASIKQFSENFITYRKRDGSVIPLLSPVQKFYVQENIKSKLETAILSVYREESDLYKKALAQAKEWTQEFYNKDDAAVQAFVETLDQLQSQTIDVDYPKTLQSPALITQLIDERLRSKVVSINNAASEEK